MDATPGHHMRRDLRAQPPAHDRRSRVRPGVVAGQFVVGAGRCGEHDRLPHTGMAAQRRFDLAQFDPVAVHLDLVVPPPEADQGIVLPAHQVARAVVVLRGQGSLPGVLGDARRAGQEKASEVVGGVEVSVHALTAPHAQFALRRRFSVVVEDHELQMRVDGADGQGPVGRRGPVGGIGGQPVLRARHGDLRGAVGVVDGPLRRDAPPRFGLPVGQRLTDEDAVTQRRGGGGRVRAVGQGAEVRAHRDHRRNGEPVRDPPPDQIVDRGEEFTRTGDHQRAAARPGDDEVEHGRIEGEVEGVGETGSRLHLVAAPVVLDVRGDVAMPGRHAFGHPGGPRGEHDIGEVVGARRTGRQDVTCRGQSEQFGLADPEDGREVFAQPGVALRGTSRTRHHRVDAGDPAHGRVAGHWVGGVERHHDRIEALYREIPHHGHQVLPGQQSDPPRDPARRPHEVRGQRLGALRQLGVAEDDLRGLDRRESGMDGHRFGEPLVQRAIGHCVSPAVRSRA
ncbi:hypothetical protein AORI_4538 [Amycolatopsis keratiniphila]|uniref:Uncharacterized protein n=1 Tax=Amycolatopsis keratiniphila TaxID=129921 RepID=R4T828_9PSEU|nr:hypothetical protein AORI_4538 [Amycolatopsis keratiniphila]